METVRISEVKGARRLGGWYPSSNFSTFVELSEMSRAKKLILGLQVNIDNNII